MSASSSSPNPVWDRILQLIEILEDQPADRLAAELSELERQGEPAEVMRRVRLHFLLPEPSQALKKGVIIGGRYRVEREVGAGAMGVVYEAIQTLSHQTVALKVIHPSLMMPEMRDRFLGEISSLGKLDHPGIVRLLHADIHRGPDNSQETVFFTMEYVSGESLDSHWSKHPPDVIEAIRVIRDLAMAIQHAHDRGVVHRDLKPGNVIIRPDGRAMVLDFGLSRLLADQAIPGLPAAGSGTPAYMAPEQAAGAAPAPAMDVFSLGAMLYEGLTGRKLVRVPADANRQQLLEALHAIRCEPLSHFSPQSPPALDDTLAKATAVSPDARYASAAALVRALQRFLPEHLVATESPRWHPASGAMVPATDWQLDKLLGRGSSGEVWLASHASLGEKRVFKFCLNEISARSLRREARLLRRLSGQGLRLPGHIPLREASLDDPPWFIAMDYVEGAMDLQAWWDRHGGAAGVPLDARLRITAQVALALQAAHDSGILHRDVKPANILVTGDPVSPESLKAWLVDFGVGSLDESIRAARMTRTRNQDDGSSADGTLLYQAPEVKDGNPATVRSDLFSLGVILYQFLRGDLRRSLPPDWAATVRDPLLREDLALCIAGEPSDRLSGGAALAERLQSLPERHAAAQRAAGEAAAREKAAYRRGVMRTLALSAAVILGLSVLAIVALWQKREATLSRGGMLLERAQSTAMNDSSPGRVARGLEFLNEAAPLVNNPVAVRSTAAALFSLPDLAPDEKPQPGIPAPPPLTTERAPSPQETTRVLSPDGRSLAIARDLDGLQGAVDLFDTSAASNHPPRITLQSESFPWLPVVEPRLFMFSPDNRAIALAGPATSKHVLVFDTVTGRLLAYLFHPHDPSAIAWHPAGRLLATGSPDGIVRVWDLAAAANPSLAETGKKDFDLPPKLDQPALDIPLCRLRGHRGNVNVLSFHSLTGMLVSADSSGYVRLWKGFHALGLPGLPEEQDAAASPSPGLTVQEPLLLLETRMDPDWTMVAADFRDRTLRLVGEDGSSRLCQYLPSTFPEEIHLSPPLTNLAWHPDGSELCAIGPNDAFWVRTAPLKITDALKGKTASHPVSVAYDPGNDAWSLPSRDLFAQYQTSSPRTENLIRKFHENKIEPPDRDQGHRTLLAATADGRAALYCGGRIQFVRDGQMTGDLTCVTRDGASRLHSLHWDRTGRLLVVGFQKNTRELILESWTTDSAFPPASLRRPILTVTADTVLPAPGAADVLLRGLGTGLTLVDAQGTLKTLNNHEWTRQAYPMALSNNGQLLALISDGQNLQLYDYPACRHLATLTNPGRGSLTRIAWHPSDRAIATVTNDGYLQHWDLVPWLNWLEARGLGFSTTSRNRQ